jgi:hypothetical protein
LPTAFISQQAPTAIIEGKLEADEDAEILAQRLSASGHGQIVHHVHTDERRRLLQLDQRLDCDRNRGAADVINHPRKIDSGRPR